MSKFEKCKFCMAYDDFEGCRAMFPESDKSCFDPNNDKIMETAKKLGISIADVVALISISK